MFLGCIIFVAVGAWFLKNPPVDPDSLLGNAVLLRIIGVLAIIFGALIGYFSIRKFFDQRPGLIISAEGITDNSSAVSAGFIPWNDIVEIREMTMNNKHFMTIVVQNPQTYIERQQNAFKRKMMQMNHSTYSAVINISANTLQCSFKELKAQLTDAFVKYHVAELD